MHRFANPTRFLALARPLTAVTLALGLACAAAGLAWGLFYAPPDYLQGETVRILYVHVPAAWLGMGGFLGVALSALAGFVWKHPLAWIGARAAAPVGAVYCALCLVTGSIWGRPAWGTWWQWDGRLTSMLVLLFIYLGVIGLAHAFDERERGDRAAGILALLGLINLPIIKFSVEWWTTLHQPASIRLTGSSIDASMLQPLLLAALGFALIFAACVLMRMRALIAAQRVAARAARLAEAHG